MAILINQGLPLARRGGEEFKYAEYGLPVLELTGDTSAMTKENPVTLAYKYKDMAGTCEVKWQGSSSLSYPKKNYTIKFDQKFEAKEGWGEQKKYCLKANFIDFSHARNIVSAKLWGKLTDSSRFNRKIIHDTFSIDRVTRLMHPNGTSDYSANYMSVEDGVLIVKHQIAYSGNLYLDGQVFAPGKHTITMDVYNPYDAETDLSNAVEVVPYYADTKEFGTVGVDGSRKQIHNYRQWTTISFELDCSREWMLSLNPYSVASETAPMSLGYKFRNILIDGKSAADDPKDYTSLPPIPNGGAIDGFPICVTLNGKYHGLYTWNIPKDEWMFGMGLGDRECILCAQGYSPATRFSGEALCDGSDYEIEYVTDENDTAWVAESLNRLIHACLSSDGSDIDTLISQYVDIDSAIDNLIFTSLISGHDCYDKNHLLVTFDGVKWFFSPYDLDSTFGNDWHGKSYKNPLTCNPMPKWAAVNNGLYRLLMQYKTDKVKARYEELRKGVLSEANVILEFENFMAGIPSAVYDADPKVWPTIPGTKTNGIAQIATNYMLRSPAADKEVEAFTPVVHSYTNLVPTLTEGASDAVFNGIGYKNEWKIDPNAGFVTYEYASVNDPYGETVCTGCLPYAISSSTGTYPSIYIKGPNLDMERLGTRTEAGGYAYSIVFCNSDKVVKWNTGMADEAVWTATNMGDNYIKLDVNAGMVVNCMGGVTRYIRFQLPGHGEGLIISIGQPIE